MPVRVSHDDLGAIGEIVLTEVTNRGPVTLAEISSTVYRSLYAHIEGPAQPPYAREPMVQRVVWRILVGGASVFDRVRQGPLLMGTEYYTGKPVSLEWRPDDSWDLKQRGGAPCESVRRSARTRRPPNKLTM